MTMAPGNMQTCGCNRSPESVPPALPATICSFAVLVGVLWLSWVLVFIHKRRLRWSELCAQASRAFVWFWAPSKDFIYWLPWHLCAQRRASRVAVFVENASKWIVPVCVGGTLYATSTWRTDTHLLANTYLSIAGLLICLAFLFISSFRQLLSPASVDLVLATVFLVFVIPGPLAGDNKSYWWYSACGYIVQMYLSLVDSNCRLFLALNLISLLWQIGVIVATPALLMDVASNIIFVVLAFTFNVSVCLSSEANLMAEVKATLLEQEVQVGAKNLLQVVCDVVVALEPDLSFSEETPTLTTMLGFRPQWAPWTEHRDFVNYLDMSDVPRFSKFVHSVDPEIPKSIHVHLINSLGHKVPMQVFHTCLWDSHTGAQKHLLGLVEDGKQGALDSHDGAELPSCAVAMRGPRPPPEEEPESEGSMSADALKAATWDAAEEEEITVSLRTWLHWEVQGESEISRALFSFGQDPDPTSTLKRFNQPACVARWMEFLHVMAACGNHGHSRMNFGKVSFQCPGSSLRYRGMMRAVLRSCPESEEEAEEVEEREFDPRAQYVELDLKIKPLQGTADGGPGPFVAI